MQWKKNDLNLFADYRRTSKLCIKFHCQFRSHVVFPLFKKKQSFSAVFGCNHFYCENYMKQRSIVYGQDAEFLDVAAGDNIRLTGFINLHLGNVSNALIIFFTFD
jgi:hypothetical protein